jgi:hypothetical protein
VLAHGHPAEAWRVLGEELLAMGELDVPKFRDVMGAIRRATITAKQAGKRANA